MADPRDSSLPFSQVAQEGSRLIRTTTPPDVGTLVTGDMVICEESWEVDDFIDACAKRGVHVRTGSFRYESEKVIPRRKRIYVSIDYPEAYREADPRAVAPPAQLTNPLVAEASQAAFSQTWDALSAPLVEKPVYVSAHGLVPEDWIPFLPYPSFNPAQEQALPHITGTGNVLVVAPTGAGKTMIGMVSALAQIKDRGGKSAWLVPQRSLTAELDRELDVWRKQGLKVVALSGESATDMAKAKSADLWVATTEKFEALCRASSMRETIAEIGTLVVDEIHLLGEPGRGPLLEALLARVRGESSRTRIIGLSATASNASEVASWLNAELVEITWRPTRLTQQVLTIPPGDRTQERRYRNLMASVIVADVTRYGGSVLVFCGTKANVRAAALAIAASRGQSISGIAQDDTDEIARVCNAAGVGLHYSDWPHKRDSEKQFRERAIDVLVATSTLAAGVNTPARAVVVLDTSIGPQPMEVSMIQQMFGRAGRAGQEAEGWSFVIATADEVTRLRPRLTAGYTIRSGILSGIADHVLSEIVQGHISTLRGAETWWISTLAHFQGEHSTAPLHAARDFLVKWRFIEVAEIGGGDQSIKATPMGALTSKLMVEVQDAANLIGRLGRIDMPSNHLAAEVALLDVLSTEVEALCSTPDAPADQAPALMRLLAAQGDVRSLGRLPNLQPGSRTRVAGSDVVKAGMLLCARSPQALATPARQVAGVNRALFNPAIYDSPRYLAFLSAIGPLGVVPSWTSIVAADLGARIAHYTLAPPRGSGRLLRMCERITGAGDRANSAKMKNLWSQVLQSGCSDPRGWPLAAPPPGSTLSDREYQALLNDRVTLRTNGNSVSAGGSAAVFVHRPGGESSGSGWRRLSAASGGANSADLIASFGSRGDWSGSGWLEHFSSIG